MVRISLAFFLRQSKTGIELFLHGLIGFPIIAPVPPLRTE